MNGKTAFEHIFKDTFIGAIIGWGAFSAFIPNVLGSISETYDLGSFLSLRLFSMVFFLLPLLVFTTYWWARGAKLYINYSSREKINDKYHGVILLAFLSAKLIIPILFISDQFFMYTCSFIEFGAFGILVFYTVLAIAEFLFFIRYYGNEVRKSKSSSIFIMSTALVFSIDIIFGLGMMTFIEPWIIYKSSTHWFVVVIGAIYVGVVLVFYLINQKGNRKLSTFKQLSVAIIIMITFFAGFPVLAWNPNIPWISILGISIALIIIILWSYFSNKGKISQRLPYSSIIGIVFLSVALWIGSGFYNDTLLKTNVRYYENRIEAREKISDTKLFPFVFFDGENLFNDSLLTIIENDGLGKSDSILIRKLKFSSYKNIIENNHAFVDFEKGRSANFNRKEVEYMGVKVKPNFKKLKNDYNVQNVYYRRYPKKSEFKNSIADTDCIHERLFLFYDSVYTYIEEGLIKKYFVPFNKPTPPVLLNARDYYHPINYYTSTLKRYKDDVKNIKDLQGHLNELALLDSLILAGKGKLIPLNSKKNLYSKIKEDLKGISFDTLSIHSLLVSYCDTTLDSNQIDSIINNEVTRYNLIGLAFSEFLPHYKSFKNRQYYVRYKKAQTIFSAYLSDTQRIGLYILFFVLIILLLLYWFHFEINPRDGRQYRRLQKLHETAGEKITRPFDELPGGFLNISIAIIIVLIVQVARPIKPENINPEQPYWMMDLDNWYQPTKIESLLGKENGVKNIENKYYGTNKNELIKILNAIEAGNEKVKVAVDNASNKITKKLEEENNQIKAAVDDASEKITKELK